MGDVVFDGKQNDLMFFTLHFAVSYININIIIHITTRNYLINRVGTEYPGIIFLLLTDDEKKPI